jgi:hypothetical protein
MSRLVTKRQPSQRLHDYVRRNTLGLYLNKDLVRIVLAYVRDDFVHTKYHYRALHRLFHFSDWETKTNMLPIADVNTLLLRFVDIWMRMDRYSFPASHCVLSVLSTTMDDTILRRLIPTYFNNMLAVINHVAKMLGFKKVKHLLCIDIKPSIYQSLENKFYTGFLFVQALIDPGCFDFVELLKLCNAIKCV